ncbi:hypothetical protein ACRYCC_10455 [Actinomadura scrupuli]|uniref:hypothetical protein n=1 Tax=Actinomadura scrupuli TaxID=559629 RepID=UPI003D99AB47
MTRQEHERRSLSALVDALEQLGAEATLSGPGASAVLFRDGTPIGGAYVVVSMGSQLSWGSGDGLKHPVWDVPGAARAIHAFMLAQGNAQC